MPVRVIAGTAKGRRLAAPKGDATRPTSDRVREALFSILGGRVQDARVLDLFAGTGALGIEALSRGARSALLCDDAPAAIAVIRRNLDGLEGGEVVRRDARALLEDARTAGRQYDLVFLDPPYKAAPRLGTALGEALSAVVAADGLVVGESDRRAPIELPLLRLTDERRYGDTLLRFHEP